MNMAGVDVRSYLAEVQSFNLNVYELHPEFSLWLEQLSVFLDVCRKKKIKNDDLQVQIN